MFPLRYVRAVQNYLEFSQITPNDAGRYYCSAANRHGNVTKVAEVIVHHNEIVNRPIQPYGNRIEVFEGDSPSLNCEQIPGASVSPILIF